MIANIIFWLSIIPFFTMVLLGMAYGFQLNSFYEQLLPRVPGFAGKQWSDFYPIKAKVAEMKAMKRYLAQTHTLGEAHPDGLRAKLLRNYTRNHLLIAMDVFFALTFLATIAELIGETWWVPWGVMLGVIVSTWVFFHFVVKRALRSVAEILAYPARRRNGVMGKPRENLPNRTCRPISRVTHRAFFPKALTISWPFRGGSLDIEC